MKTKRKKLKILLVEDDGYMSDIIKNYAESEGYKIDAALSFDDAVKIFVDKNGKYDVLIVDFRLGNAGGKNGMDVHEQATKKNPNIKTIMISAFGNYPVKKEAFKRGIYKFLDKPFFLEELTFAINN